jgi:two-component system LytT family response regulator
MKIKAIAVDDNESALKIIKKLTEDIDYIDVVATFSKALEAGNYLNKNKDIDLIFLDINMPEMNGFDFLKTFKPNQAVIFISKHTEQAIDTYNVKNSFGIKVVDFLSIPVKKDEFIRACLGVYNNIKNSRDSINISEIEKTSKKNYIIKYNEIVLIEADEVDSHLMNIHITSERIGKKILLTRKTLNDLEKELPSDKFIRVSKKAIINIDKIIMHTNEEITMSASKKITIGDNWKKKFKNAIEK